jgi:hypothetical protein
VGALTAPDNFFPQCTTSLILLNRLPFDGEYKAGLAHELFHAFQFGFPGRRTRTHDWPWLDEATATWMASRIYPLIDIEQAFLYGPRSVWNTSVAERADCQGRRPARLLHAALVRFL